MKAWNALHRGIYRATGGRVLGHFGKFPVLLLTTIGPRSGKTRTNGALYLRDGERLIVVAAASGAPRDPAWCLNLRADPQASVQIGSEHRDVIAREAAGGERERLWERLAEWNPRYADAQRKSGRTLPVIVLERPA